MLSVQRQLVLIQANQDFNINIFLLLDVELHGCLCQLSITSPAPLVYSQPGTRPRARHILSAMLVICWAPKLDSGQVSPEIE